MMATMDIPVTKVQKSRLPEVDFDNLPFGKVFTDHMLEADYENGEWKNVQIKPYGPLTFTPAMAVLHYGQAIFEGIKAYKDAAGNAYIFRPYDNFKRFNVSAQRMQMPEVPEEIFVDGMTKLISLDKDWIPSKEDNALYIRPFMISTDELIGVRPSDKYKFLIILSPSGPYYNAPMRLMVEEKYVRAAEGGAGYAKAAGNYGAAMFPTAQAKMGGYDQVLWTDATEHKYVQECGTMNVFFIIGDTAITPDLSQGTILAGVTRMSVITLLKDMGLKVEERPLGIDEIVAAYKEGQLKEIFGTGTAATISYVQELKYNDVEMKFATDSWKTAAKVKERLTDIRVARAEDVYNWMYPVK
ncbi:MAG TPA: branched-chain amino acid aminotransferase [Chitinophagaceae bacterium]|nr:branched-chain amino acid aminotransferase [Chitinophagaceae bacterium]